VKEVKRAREDFFLAPFTALASFTFLPARVLLKRVREARGIH